MQVIEALEKHRSTFLSSPVWTTLPWQIHPKSMFDRLIDLLAMGPVVLEKGDRVGQVLPHLFLPALVEVVEEVKTLDSRLQTYYTELSDGYSGPLYWESSSAVTTLDDRGDTAGALDCGALTPFRFRDIEMARILTLYWAMLAMVWAGLTDLYTTVEENITASEAEQVLHLLALEPKNWLEPIRKVCQSVEFCTSEGPPGIGPLVLAVSIQKPTCSFSFTDSRTGSAGCGQRHYETTVWM